MHLAADYLGLSLRNPTVASTSPLTLDLDKIRRIKMREPPLSGGGQQTVIGRSRANTWNPSTKAPEFTASSELRSRISQQSIKDSIDYGRVSYAKIMIASERG